MGYTPLLIYAAPSASNAIFGQGNSLIIGALLGKYRLPDGVLGVV